MEKKAKAPVKKAAVKTVKAAVKAPVKKTAVKPAAKAPVKKTAVKPAVKTPVKKATVKPAAKKTEAVKKTVVKAPVKKTEVVKKTVVKAPVKKTAPVKKAEPVKQSVKPEVTAAPTVHRLENGQPLKKRRLTKAEKAHFYELLMHARASFGQQIKFHSDDALSNRKDSAGERPGMATHMADLGTDNFRHDFELGLLSEEVDVLEMIDEALERLEESEYGVCLDCGMEIPVGRLESKPYAKYCTKCKSRREEMDEESGGHRR